MENPPAGEQADEAALWAQSPPSPSSDSSPSSSPVYLAYERFARGLLRQTNQGIVKSVLAQKYNRLIDDIFDGGYKAPKMRIIVEKARETEKCREVTVWKSSPPKPSIRRQVQQMLRSARREQEKQVEWQERKHIPEDPETTAGEGKLIPPPSLPCHPQIPFMQAPRAPPPAPPPCLTTSESSPPPVAEREARMEEEEEEEESPRARRASAETKRSEVGESVDQTFTKETPQKKKKKNSVQPNKTEARASKLDTQKQAISPPSSPQPSPRKVSESKREGVTREAKSISAEAPAAVAPAAPAPLTDSPRPVRPPRSSESPRAQPATRIWHSSAGARRVRKIDKATQWTRRKEEAAALVARPSSSDTMSAWPGEENSPPDGEVQGWPIAQSSSARVPFTHRPLPPARTSSSPPALADQEFRARPQPRAAEAEAKDVLLPYVSVCLASAPLTCSQPTKRTTTVSKGRRAKTNDTKGLGEGERLYGVWVPVIDEIKVDRKVRKRRSRRMRRGRKTECEECAGR
eukprot:748377-Hanusia_phi.AAC.1